MEPWLETIARWLPSGPWYYLCLGLISLLESLAVVGIFVPGSVLIVLAGFLAAHGQGEPLPLMVVSSAGAIMGDLLSFALGARYGTSILQSSIMRRRRKLIHKAREFFIDHGGKSVFFGRFLGFLRPFIPVIAGSAQMPAIKFSLYAVVSGILWGLAYPGLGYFFGASWSLVKVWTGRFSILIIFFLILLIVNHLFWRKIFPLLVRLGEHLWVITNSGMKRLADTAAIREFSDRHPALHGFVLNRFSPAQGTGLILTIGFFVSLAFALGFFWISRAILRQTPLARLDHEIYLLLRDLHEIPGDVFFLIITQFGSLNVIIPLAVLVLVWMVLHHRDFSSLILTLGLLCGEALVVPLKYVFERSRPSPLIAQMDPVFFSFPSMHAYNSLVFYGLLTYFLLGSVRYWENRFYLAFSSSFFVLVIGFSRVYLGAHWLSDVLGGFVLGGFWLTALITACEMRFRYDEFPLPKGWRPMALRRRGRFMILIPLALVAIIWIAMFVLVRVGVMESPFGGHLKMLLQ